MNRITTINDDYYDDIVVTCVIVSLADAHSTLQVHSTTK